MKGCYISKPSLMNSLNKHLLRALCKDEKTAPHPQNEKLLKEPSF